MIKGIIFDLDDTLYYEKDYVKSGFKAVALEISKNTTLNFELIEAFLFNLFDSGIRGNTFNLLFEAFPEIAHKFLINDLINIYRSHIPEIKLLPEIKKMILFLRTNKYKTGIITDGYKNNQEKKIKSLGLETLIDIIIYTDQWGREYWKPSIKAFEEASKILGLTHSELCYIGDNPEKDFLAPRSLGWCTIRYRHPNQLNVKLEPKTLNHAPHFDMDNYDKLITIMNNWNWRKHE